MRRAEFHLYAKPLPSGAVRASVSVPMDDGALHCLGKLEMSEPDFQRLRDLLEEGAEQLGRRVMVGGPAGDPRFARQIILNERAASS